MLIMSGRIEKSRPPSKKTEERHRLVALIDSFGVDIMPCSFCESRHLRCQMMEGVSRCKECVRRGRSCDGVFVASSIQKVLAAEERLKLEEEQTEEKLLAAQQALNEAVARLLRIRKQRASLKTRGVDLAKRCASSLDELDAQEQAEAEAAIDVQAGGAMDVVDWSAVFHADPSLGLDFPGETPQVPSAGPADVS